MGEALGNRAYVGGGCVHRKRACGVNAGRAAVGAGAQVSDIGGRGVAPRPHAHLTNRAGQRTFMRRPAQSYCPRSTRSVRPGKSPFELQPYPAASECRTRCNFGVGSSGERYRRQGSLHPRPHARLTNRAGQRTFMRRPARYRIAMLISAYLPSTLSAVAATFSPVKPNSLNSWPAGADAPK